ncbi:hypothetical protein GKT70_13815 [Salmonella enterica]|nr:hypothetical protein [Salmonella enterica]
MLNLNRFICIPLCLLLFSSGSFSAVVYNRASANEINQYASTIRSFVMNQSRGIFYYYKGKRCSSRLHIYRNGSFLFNIESGSPDLCKQVFLVLSSIKKLPAPPSETVYQAVKNCTFDFKF